MPPIPQRVVHPAAAAEFFDTVGDAETRAGAEVRPYIWQRVVKGVADGVTVDEARLLATGNITSAMQSSANRSGLVHDDTQEKLGRRLRGRSIDDTAYESPSIRPCGRR